MGIRRKNMKLFRELIKLFSFDNGEDYSDVDLWDLEDTDF